MNQVGFSNERGITFRAIRDRTGERYIESHMLDVRCVRSDGLVEVSVLDVSRDIGGAIVAYFVSLPYCMDPLRCWVEWTDMVFLPSEQLLAGHPRPAPLPDPVSVPAAPLRRFRDEDE